MLHFQFSFAPARSLSVFTASRLNHHQQVNFKWRIFFPNVDPDQNKLTDNFWVKAKNPFILKGLRDNIISHLVTLNLLYSYFRSKHEQFRTLLTRFRTILALKCNCKVIANTAVYFVLFCLLLLFCFFVFLLFYRFC